MLQLTPRYHVLTLGAGAYETISQYGRFISIWGISASTITLQVDDDAPQLVANGMQIDCQDRHYKRIRLRNTGGVASVVILYLSDTPIADTRSGALAAAMALSLANIDVDTTNINNNVVVGNGHLVNIRADTAAMAIDLAALEILSTAANVLLGTIDADTGSMATDLGQIETLLEIPDTPTDINPTVIAATGAEIQIVAAAAASRVVFLQAADDNAGDVYLRFTTGVTDAIYSVRLHPGENWREECAWSVFACSDNGTETLNGYVGAIA